MLRFFFTSLLLVIPVLLFAQSSVLDPQVTSSPDLDLPSRSLPGLIVGTSEKGTILTVDKFDLTASSVKPSLMKLDDDLKPLLLRTLVSDYEGKDMILESVEIVNDELYVFSSFFNAKTKKEFLFARRYDSETLEPAGELLPISTLSDQSSNSEDHWTILITKDKKKLAIISRMFGKKKRKPGTLTVQMLDADMAETSQYSLTLPGTEERIFVGAKVINSDGKVFLIVNDQGEFNARKGRTPTSTLYAFAPGATDLQKIPLDLEGNLTYQHHLAVHEDNTISVTGTYKEEIDEIAVGFFHMTVSADPIRLENNAFIPVISPEDQEGYQIHQGEEISKKNAPEQLGIFAIAEVEKSSDGGHFIVGSHPASTTRSYKSGNIYRNVTTYSEGNISVIRILADGTVGWIRTVPRDQTYPDRLSGVLGQASGLYKDKLYLYFNDEIENVGKFTQSPQELKPRNGCITRLVRISADGNVEDTIVQDSRERKTWSMIPKTYFDQRSGELLTFVFTKSDISVQRVKL